MLLWAKHVDSHSRVSNVSMGSTNPVPQAMIATLACEVGMNKTGVPVCALAANCELFDNIVQHGESELCLKACSCFAIGAVEDHVNKHQWWSSTGEVKGVWRAMVVKSEERT